MLGIIALIFVCVLSSTSGPATRLASRSHSLLVLLPIPILIVTFVIIRGPGLALALAMILTLSGWKFIRMRKNRASTAAAEATSKMLGSIVGDVRAGATPHEAIVHLTHDAPVALAELCTLAAHRCASGVTPAAAFVDAPEPYRDLRSAARLWLIADQRGIALAGLLEHMQHRIEARLRHTRATSAALQGAQATALILSALPLAGLAMGTAMGARPWQFLTGSMLGQSMLVIGVFLACSGVVWVDWIVSGAARERGAK